MIPLGPPLGYPMEVMRKVSCILLFLALIPAVAGPQGMQQPLAQGAPGQALVGMLREVRLAMYFSALAILAPTIKDQHLYAQQVVNILEGSEGKHFMAHGQGKVMGLIPAVDRLQDTLSSLPEPRMRRALFILENIRAYLRFTLEEALATLGGNDLRVGADHMRKAFAFLYFVSSGEERPPLGGLRALLRYLHPTPP